MNDLLNELLDSEQCPASFLQMAQSDIHFMLSMKCPGRFSAVEVNRLSKLSDLTDDKKKSEIDAIFEEVLNKAQPVTKTVRLDI